MVTETMNMPISYQNQYQIPYQNQYQIPSIPEVPMPYQNQDLIPSAPEEQSDMDVKKDQEKEIKEAIIAADEALTYLRKAKKHLNRANNWSLFDLFGGDLLISALKHGSISDARRQLNLSKDALTKLNEKLKDANIEVLAIKISGILEVTDIFLDNIISDIMVQTKISDTKNSCKKAIHDVEAIKKDLEERLQNLPQPN